MEKKRGAETIGREIGKGGESEGGGDSAGSGLHVCLKTARSLHIPQQCCAVLRIAQDSTLGEVAANCFAEGMSGT